MRLIRQIGSILVKAHAEHTESRLSTALSQASRCTYDSARDLSQKHAFHGTGAALVAARSSAAQESSGPPVHPERRRLHWTVLLLPAGVAAFLGTWQVGRQQWKLEQVQQREAGLQAEPVAISQATEALPEYRRVWCQGELLHERSIFVGPRPRTVMGSAKPGYVLVTPLVNREWGQAVLVNRGWVPAEWKSDAQLRASGCPAGKVHVEGVIRESEKPSSFVPENSPSKGEWYWVDVPAMARAAGLPPDTPLIEVVRSEDAGLLHVNVPTTMEILAGRTRGPSAAQQYPIQREIGDLMNFSVMPSDHRNYALTWYSLSVATAFLALRAARTR
ncbi:g4603 [Coccomyxa viridis]|uniref:SURF1-like protein n=1 Tax=Coccomyxa viridis TaxID=1274662 RepID=A0ABP1FQP5_9CHLO